MTSITRLISEQPKVFRDPAHCMMWGAYVCAVRNALGMSQSDLAAILGVTRTTLTRLEQGIPPLKAPLCRTALEVFKEAGVKSASMDDVLLIGSGIPTSLDISIEIHHPLHSSSELGICLQSYMNYLRLWEWHHCLFWNYSHLI